MRNKIVRVIWNGIRFLGSPAYKNLLAVELSTKISRSSKAEIVIGKKFRSRNNVEINVRDRAVVRIGNDVFLNSGCILTARESISIGDNTIFGPNVVVYDHDHLLIEGKVVDNKYETAPVIIGSNVWIGAGTIILKGTEIGDNCVIAAGSVVKGKVEAGSLFVQKREKTIVPMSGRM